MGCVYRSRFPNNLYAYARDRRMGLGTIKLRLPSVGVKRHVGYTGLSLTFPKLYPTNIAQKCLNLRRLGVVGKSCLNLNVFNLTCHS